MIGLLIVLLIIVIVIIVKWRRLKIASDSAAVWLAPPADDCATMSSALCEQMAIPPTTPPPSYLRQGNTTADANYAMSILARFITTPQVAAPLFGFDNVATLITAPIDATTPIASVWANATSAVVAFRGTLTAADLMSDLHYGESVSEDGARVHSGMYGIYKSIRHKLLAAIPAGITSIFVTGHSLGAALASYFILDIPVAAQKELMVFAPPRAGNAAFAAAVSSSCRYLGYINLADMIPSLPWSYMPNSVSPYTPDAYSLIAPIITINNLQSSILGCHLLPAYYTAINE